MVYRLVFLWSSSLLDLWDIHTGVTWNFLFLEGICSNSGSGGEVVDSAVLVILRVGQGASCQQELLVRVGMLRMTLLLVLLMLVVLLLVVLLLMMLLMMMMA